MKNFFIFLLAFVRWLPSAFIAIFFTILAFILSPLLAIPYTTGTWEGQARRQFMPNYLAWFATPDAPVDEWWRGDYYKTAYTWSSSLTNTDFENSKWLQYIARLMWIVRNPAYGISYDMGYDSINTNTRINSGSGVWDSGKTMWAFTLVEDKTIPVWKRYAFSFKLEWFYVSSRFLRIWLGWKLPADATGPAEVASHINPIHPYSSN